MQSRFPFIAPRRVAQFAIALYLVSLALPVVGGAFGIMALALGWCPPYTPFWIANLAFAYGVLKLPQNDRRRGRNAGVVASLLALLYLSYAFKGPTNKAVLDPLVPSRSRPRNDQNNRGDKTALPVAEQGVMNADSAD
jgi:hypothetical protein